MLPDEDACRSAAAPHIPRGQRCCRKATCYQNRANPQPSAWTSRAPFALRIKARDAFTRVRILQIPKSIPDHSADIEFIVENSGSAGSIPVDRGGTPAGTARSQNTRPVD